MNVGATRWVARRLPARRSIRLKKFDYRQADAYFVTICAEKRQPLFGEIRFGIVGLNDTGCVVVEEWLRTAELRPYVELDAFAVMPNHFHGIIILHGTAAGDPAGRPYGKSLGSIIGQFKSVVSKRVGRTVWQRNYFGHVIRDERGLTKIREYIANNPLTWTLDRENPNRRGSDAFDEWIRSQPAPKRATQRVAFTNDA